MDIPEKILGINAVVLIGVAVLFYFKYIKPRREAA